MPWTWVVTSMVPFSGGVTGCCWWVTCQRSISCPGSCHGTNQILVPRGAKQDQGMAPTARSVLGRDAAGKVGCMWNLTGICFPNSYCWCFLTMGYYPQGVVGRSSSVFLRQVGWLAAQACDMGFRKDGDEAGSSEQGWGKPHHESHIKQSILNALFPPQHGRKAG